MRSLRSDLIGIRGGALNGATFFEFPEFMLRHWSNGIIVVDGNVDRTVAKKLAGDVVSILGTDVVSAVTVAENYLDDQPTDPGPS